MVKKAMDNPALFRHSKIKPSAQAVINHSYYMGQSLLTLSNSSSDDESNFFSGVKLSSRESIASKNDDSSLDDPSVLERVVYYDSGDESSSTLTYLSNLDALPVTVQYMSASSESDVSKDSLDIDDDEYYDLHIYDEDDFVESLGFDGGNQNHNSNIGSVGQPWTVYLETAPEDENTPLPSSFPDFLSFMEMGYAESLQAYLDVLESHVHPEFAKKTEIMHLLRTKGVKVFVPQNWDGIKVKPLHINFIEGMPAVMKPKARPVNPKLFEHAKKEFDRLLSYMYVRCDGPVASPLVITSKATAPFIRFCGDYQDVNRFIPHWHTPIPHPQRTISEKLVNHDAYGDIDMTNGLHQLPIDEKTSMKLSIQTPWGQVRPLFLPEGVPIGNAHLQKTMSEIFKHCEWAIVIFDNILICASGYDDLYSRIDIALDLYIKYNVTLNMEKTWLGFPEVKFFWQGIL